MTRVLRTVVVRCGIALALLLVIPPLVVSGALCLIALGFLAPLALVAVAVDGMLASARPPGTPSRLEMASIAWRAEQNRRATTPTPAEVGGQPGG